MPHRTVQRLKDIMRRENTLLRELLASIEHERQMLLQGDAQQVKIIHEVREPILEAVEQAREGRADCIRTILDNPELEASATTEAIEACPAGDRSELVDLRNQLVALLEQLRDSTERNNHLLHNKIQLTKNVMDQVQPKDPNQTYGAGGKVKPAVKTATLTLINKEV